MGLFDDVLDDNQDNNYPSPNSGGGLFDDVIDRETDQTEEDKNKDKSFLSRTTEAAKNYLKSTINRESFGRENIKTTFKIMGREFVSGLDQFGNNIADLIARSSNFIFGDGWSTDDPLMKSSDERIQSDITKSQSMASNESQKKVGGASRFLGEQTGYFLIPEAGGVLGKVGGSGIKGISKTSAGLSERMAQKTMGGFFARTTIRGTENTVIGSVFDIAQNKEEKEILKNAATNFVAGSVMSAGLEGIVNGIAKSKNLPRWFVTRKINDEYGRRLVEEVDDVRIIKELLDNGSISPKISSSVEESLNNVGADLTKTDAIMTTPEGQRAFASEIVYGKMSQRAKRAIYNEIKNSELFAIESGDPVDTVIQKGVDSILANGDNTGKLKLTRKYTESVLGVVNPELNKIDEALSQSVDMAPEVKPETPTAPQETIVEQKRPNAQVKPEISNENLLQIKEAVDSGDKEAAAALHAAFSEDFNVPDIKDIERVALANKTKESIEKFRGRLQEMTEYMKLERERLIDERGLFDAHLGKGTVDDIKKILRSKKWAKGEIDVSGIEGFDDIAQSVRGLKENYELTDNEVLDMIDALPTKAELKEGVPTVGKGDAGYPGYVEVKAKEIKPVKTQGKIRESAAYKKTREMLMERHADELEELGKSGSKKLEYRQADLEKQAEKAAKIISDNPKRAERIAANLEPYPDDVLQESVTLAVAQDALDKGDIDKYRRLQESLSLRNTRRGQEIAALKGRVDVNSPDYFIHEVMRERTDRVKDSSLITDSRGKSKSARVKDTIDSKVKDLSAEVKNASIKIEEAQKLIDKLTCK